MITLEVFGIILAAVLGFTASLLSGLVLLNLRTINARVGKLEEGQVRLFDRKAVCNQDFVNKVDFIRAVTSIESTMKDLVKNTSELKGTMKAVEQMPAIVGSVAKNIVQEMNDDRKTNHD